MFVCGCLVLQMGVGVRLYTVTDVCWYVVYQCDRCVLVCSCSVLQMCDGVQLFCVMLLFYIARNVSVLCVM